MTAGLENLSSAYTNATESSMNNMATLINAISGDAGATKAATDLHAGIVKADGEVDQGEVFKAVQLESAKQSTTSSLFNQGKEGQSKLTQTLNRS
ncbi:MAG TPA: hypothetical protein DCS13_02280 [Candidatus Margulisbacteria bacterium]|nr:hypothetical protein [Candidatus Margulisiibacteriota bacterium]HAR62268.1 hypothetical protein [Candidatus Margulisiibacteriota bacterium]